MKYKEAQASIRVLTLAEASEFLGMTTRQLLISPIRRIELEDGEVGFCRSDILAAMGVEEW